METFFMNTKNSKTNEPHRLKYNLIAFITLGKMLNRFVIIISLKFPRVHGMIHLIYLMDRIIYQKYKIISNT